VSVKQAFRQFLAGASQLSALGGRVYKRLPEGGPSVRPALTYRRVRVLRPKTQEGTGGLARSAFEVDVWGGGDGPYQDASDLAEVVRPVLTGQDPVNYGPGFQGAIGYQDKAGQPQTVSVQKTLADDEQDLDQAPGEFGRDYVQECVTLRFTVWHLE